MSYSVVVAGTTDRTTQCAEALRTDSMFTISGVLTPTPKAIGRKQTLTKNPLHAWADSHSFPVTLVERKLDASIQEQLKSAPRPDFLLVVDFGYIVPQWLLDFPTIGPINIHPSALPAYRGSSPGQFVLAMGETKSAVTLMVMDAKLDHGPIITQFPFAVERNWSTQDYYACAFALVTDKLGNTLTQFALTPHSSPQPDDSPTPTARMLTREDGFIPWETLQELLGGKKASAVLPIHAYMELSTTPQSVYNLWRGLHPWPGIWTTVFIEGQQKRLKILECSVLNNALQLQFVQLEGKTSQSFSTFPLCVN